MADPVMVPIEDGRKPPDPDQDDREQQRKWGGFALVAIILILLMWWLLSHIAMVPTTVGMSRTRAEDLIRYAGFETSVTIVPTDPQRAGVVLVQAPTHGWYLTWWPVAIAVGSESLGQDTSENVALQIDRRSSGIDVTSTASDVEVMPTDLEEVAALYEPPHVWERLMPNVLDKTKSAALHSLGRAGLQVTVKSGPSTTFADKGHIYYQYPEPGSEIQSGDHATIWVSEGVLRGGGSYPRPPSPPGE